MAFAYVQKMKSNNAQAYEYLSKNQNVIAVNVFIILAKRNHIKVDFNQDLKAAAGLQIEHNMPEQLQAIRFEQAEIL